MQLKENKASHLQFLGCDSEPGILLFISLSVPPHQIDGNQELIARAKGVRRSNCLTLGVHLGPPIRGIARLGAATFTWG